MIHAELIRFDRSTQGSFGRFSTGPLSLYSGELPDHGNEPNISCIPVGEYKCYYVYSPRFRRFVYLVAGVIGRLGIRIHPANLMGDLPPWRRQLNGCIALGEKLGWIDNQKALLLSQPAIRRFEEYMAGRPFLLEIKNA